MTEKNYYERYWRNQSLGSDQRNSCESFKEDPYRWDESNLQRVLSFCSGVLKGKVLDAGCGDGFFLNQLTFFDEVKDIRGIDVSEKAIEMALEKYPKNKFCQTSLDKIPFESIKTCRFIAHNNNRF